MISLPLKPKVVSEENNKAVIEVEGLFPGYGQTIGNSLRRVLLSSLRGATITSIKIKDIGHEFSTLEGVMENVVEIILNLKQIKFRMHQEEPISIGLSASGEKEIKSGDFKTPSQVEVLDKNMPVATLTSKKARLEMEATVETGLGYVPIEARGKEKVEVGTIALDAAFSPVRHVNYEVENMRVGDRTDYDKIIFHIETDGSITPLDAFQRSAEILVGQFSALSGGFSKVEEEGLIHKMAAPSVKKEFGDRDQEESKEGDETMKIRLDTLKFSSRTLNALRESGIKTVGGLARKKEDTLREIEGLGDKGIQEIKKALGNFGITLRQ